MSTTRLFSANDITSDTGEMYTTSGALSHAPPYPDPDYSETMVRMRLRVKTNTPSLTGQFLVSVRWNDGVSDQSWDVSLNNTSGAYTEVGMDIWCDASRNLTVQVQPIVADGSVDVRLLGDY